MLILILLHFWTNWAQSLFRSTRSTSSHLYAVTGTSNQLYISWWNQDELQGIKRAQKPSFAVSFDPVQWRDYAARSTSQQPFNSRPLNWTTVDQALGRSRAIYIGKNWAQKPGFFCLFTWASAAFWPCYHRRDYATQPIPNKPSIPDPRIEQTDDQALGRPRVIYIGDKRAQKAGV